MFIVEHNVKKRIRWETSKAPIPLSTPCESSGCNPSLPVPMSTAGSAEGGMALMGVVMLCPSKVHTTHLCALQLVHRRVFISHLLALFKLV